jgi:hypothetical protein
MRYVAKIHVLDILEEVVVSGYVYDADPLTNPDVVTYEFSQTVGGRGLDDPLGWLHWHLYDALQIELARSRSQA